MKKIIFSILLITILGGASLAQQQPPPYPTGYWIMGTVERGDLPADEPLSGFTVIFYKESGKPGTASATGETNGDGKFLINAHDDLRLLPLNPGQTYYIGVVKKKVGDNYYGVTQRGLEITADDLSNGYKKNITLSLVVEPKPVEFGTIEGIVTEEATGAAIAGATVEVVGTAYKTETLSDGTYIISSIATGEYTVQASKVGYVTQTKEGIVVEKDKVTTVNFALVPLLIVINTADSGPGSLRGVINYANLHSGPDRIVFNIPTTDPGYTTEAGASWWRIQPTSEALPFLTGDGTVIDGTTQTAKQGDTNSKGPEIEIDGSKVAINALNASGLTIHANNCTIEGLTIKEFPEFGVLIENGASSNIIGGSTDAERNIVSENMKHGILIRGEGTDSNIIKGNYIVKNGLAGAAQGAGHAGIAINDANSTEVQGNVISGNGTHGIQIADASETLITGNRIGIDKNGSAMGNGGDGVSIGATTESNTVGPNNIIAHNTNSGVDITGVECIRNTITRNSMFKNSGPGIALTDGGNENIGYPAIISANYNPSTGSTEVVGTAEASATVEVFLADPDPSGFGEGRTYEASTTSDKFGNWSITISGLNPGDRVTATVTKDRNTSEFAKNVEVSLPAPPLTILTTSLPNGIVGQAYSATLEATGGTPPYTWSISGSLPSGLTLEAETGWIRGTPEVEGTFTFTIEVTDSVSPPNKDTQALSIIVKPKPVEFGTIEGIVTDEATGLPIEGATVEVIGQWYRLPTDNEGKYVFSSIATGEYTVQASKVGYVTQTKEGIVVEKDKVTTANFALVPVPVITYGTIEGSVSTGAGVPIEGAVVTLEAEGKFYSATSEVLTGHYMISDIPAGTYTVTCTKKGYYPLSKLATVEAGKKVAIDFALVPIPPVGPVVNLTLLLEGLNRGTPDNNIPTTVEVELRTGGSAADTALPQNAAATCEIRLLTDGKGSNNGSWYDNVQPSAGQRYYLVIRQKIPGAPVGANHIPIITRSSWEVVSQPASLEVDPSSADLAYTPTGLVPAMREITYGGIPRLHLRAGYFDLTTTPKVIDIFDLNIWKRAIERSATVNPSDPESVTADGNSDGVIDIFDLNLWKRTVENFGRQTDRDHVYVP